MQRHKHFQTVNPVAQSSYLIGITPAETVSFLSAGWEGRACDRKITLKPGFLNLWRLCIS